MTLENGKAHPMKKAVAADQPKFSSNVEPPRQRQPSAPFRLGHFTKSIMAQAQSEDSCLSPNTIQMLINPMRSQLGLPSIALSATPPPKHVKKLELGSSGSNERVAVGEKNYSGMSSGSNSRQGNDLMIEPGNNILNISFTGESELKPNYNFTESYNMNDQTGMAGDSSFGIPSHIQEDTRSFVFPKTGENLTNWTAFGGAGDNNKSYDIPRFNNKSLAESEDNNNDSQDSFMLNRRKITYDDSIDGINHPFDKISLLATERSRFASSPDRSGNIWGETRALSVSTPDLTLSKKIPVDPLELFSFAEEKSELYKPSLENNQYSPAFTKPVGMGFQNQNQSMKMNSTHTSAREKTNSTTEGELAYPSSGFVLSSRQNTVSQQSRKLSKVDEVSSSSTFTSNHPVSQPTQPRQFGRCIESDAQADAKELSREFQKNQGSNFTFNKPTPLKQSFLGRFETTPKASITSDNNSVNVPEIAARIPTGRGSGGDAKKEGRCHTLGTPMNIGRHAKTLGNPPSASGKVKTNSKEKKPTTGSGWKFSSEHVEEKEYLVIKQLGKGGCGEVHLVIEKESRQLFALKKVSLAGIDDASVQECVNEVQMLVDLKDSDLVVHIYAWEFNKSEKTMKIIMEHGQCDLNFSIRTVNSSAHKLKSIWERILMIVDVIHKRGIVHADLKPANFIWAGDNLKIIDFGIASKLQQDHTSIAMLSPKGTLNFISPETIQPDAYGRAKIGPKSDIWSLGCILYLMVFGRTPFEHITHPVAKMNAIVKGEIQYPHLPSQLQSSGSDLLYVLKSCFQLDYKIRPTTTDLLHQPFLKR